MKILILGLAVALVFTYGEALDCHHCVSKKAGDPCDLTVTTCKPGKTGCAAAKFLSAPFGQYQKCMAMSDCKMLQANAFINIKCCDTDMCNTY